MLLPLAASLWVSLVFLLQLEARNRLADSPGESSPLRLALYGVPLVVLATGACLAAELTRRRRGGSAVALLAPGLLLVGAAVALVGTRSYLGAMQEFATLPWDALRAR